MVSLLESRFLDRMTLPTTGARKQTLLQDKATKARRLFESGDFLGSLHEYESLKPSFESNPNLLALIGFNLFKLGRFTDAISNFEQANALQPDDPDIVSMLGAAFGSAGRVEEALQLFTQADTMKPHDPDIVHNHAVALRRLGLTKDALRVIDVYLKSQHAAGNEDFLSLRRTIVEEALRRLVRSGFASWSGGKPQGSEPGIEITPGPPISDYVIEDRR